MSLFNELKRRNVFRVSAAYLVATWVLAQVVDLFLGYVDAPDWVMHVFLLFAAVGFVAAVIVAWAYELTPDGIKRESDVDRNRSIVADTGRKLDRIIIGFLALAVVLLLTDRYLRPPAEESLETGSDAFDTATSTGHEAGEQKSEAQAPSAKTIAVLPFADLSQAGDQEWFADGLAEEILNALAKTPDLQVSSRTSAFRYKDSELGIPQIATELGVAHILEGSVRSSGNRIRVTAQLIRAEDGFHVWSENYDRDEADMIEIQEDLAVQIAGALETTMDPQALAEMSRVGTRSVEAYTLYLKSQSLYVQSTAQSSADLRLESLDLLEQARSIDPGFTAAHRGVANFWRQQMQPGYVFGGITQETHASKLERHTIAINLAIESAQFDIERTALLAQKAHVEVRLRDAIRLFREYLEDRPNDHLALYQYVNAAQIGSDSEAIQDALNRLHDLSERFPDLATTYMSNAYQFEDPSAVADFGLGLLARRPNDRGLLYQTHRALMWAGRGEEGALLAQQFETLGPSQILLSARQACIEGRSGEVEALLKGIQQLEGSINHILKWIMLKMLGRDAEAVEIWRPYDEQGAVFSLSTLLSYRIFDPTPYPSLMKALQAESVDRSSEFKLPFRCPAQ